MNATSDPRRPRAFSPSEAEIIEPAAPQAETAGEGAPAQPTLPAGLQMPTFGDIGRGVRWGTWLLSAMGALASIAFGVWFSRFVSVAVAREDWIGWISFGLAIIILVTLLMLILRELIGFVRLRRLGKIKAVAEKALRERNVAEERETIAAIVRLLAAAASCAGTSRVWMSTRAMCAIRATSCALPIATSCSFSTARRAGSLPRPPSA